MNFCSQCGAARGYSDKFCGGCGSPFAEQAAHEHSALEAEDKSTDLSATSGVEMNSNDVVREVSPDSGDGKAPETPGANQKKSSVSRNSMLALFTVGVAVLIIASIVLRVPFAGISSQDSTQTSASNDSTQTSPESSCVGLGCYAAVSAVADGTEISITVIPYLETSGMLESVEASPTNSWGESLRASGCEDFWNEMKKTLQGWELSCTTITDVTTADRPPVVGFRASLRNGEVVRLTVPIKSIDDLSESGPDAEERLRQAPTQVESQSPAEPYGGQCALVVLPALDVALIASGLGYSNFDIDSPAARDFVERRGFQSFETWIAEVELLNPFLNMLDSTKLTQEENNVVESLTRALEPGEMASALSRADADWYRMFETNLISILATCDG